MDLLIAGSNNFRGYDLLQGLDQEEDYVLAFTASAEPPKKVPIDWKDFGSKTMEQVHQELGWFDPVSALKRQTLKNQMNVAFEANDSKALDEVLAQVDLRTSLVTKYLLNPQVARHFSLDAAKNVALKYTLVYRGARLGDLLLHHKWQVAKAGEPEPRLFTIDEFMILSDPVEAKKSKEGGLYTEETARDDNWDALILAFQLCIKDVFMKLHGMFDFADDVRSFMIDHVSKFKVRYSVKDSPYGLVVRPLEIRRLFSA